MKKIIAILLAFIPLFLFSSCKSTSEDKDVIAGREVYQAYFNKVLKDPSSFKVYSEKYTKEENAAMKWKLDYGAKNSFGGMVREQVEFKTIGHTILINDGIFDLEDLEK